jgi:hypothetical protein
VAVGAVELLEEHAARSSAAIAVLAPIITNVLVRRTMYLSLSRPVCAVFRRSQQMTKMLLF